MTVNRKPTVGTPARFARGMTCDQYVAYIGPRRTSSARQGAAVRLAGTMSGGEQQMLAMGRPLRQRGTGVSFISTERAQDQHVVLPTARSGLPSPLKSPTASGHRMAARPKG